MELTIEEHQTNVKPTFSLLEVIPNMNQAGGVDVLHAEELDEVTFQKLYVQKNKACIIKGAVEHWPAFEKWKSKEYLQNHTDNSDVEVYTHVNYIDSEMQEDGKEIMKFHDALDRLYEHTDDVFSIPSEEITDQSHLKGVKTDVLAFKFLKNAPFPRIYPRVRVFTYRQASTSWHYHDMDETLMCQVKGTKRVGLLPPTIPNTKEISLFLQHEDYLKGKTLDAKLQLNPMMVDVEAGDALYIPPYWYHGVVPVDDEIGYTVAFCWKSPLHKLGNFSSYYVRQLFKQAVTPFNKFTLIYPFIALVAGVSYLINKIIGRA